MIWNITLLLLRLLGVLVIAVIIFGTSFYYPTIIYDFPEPQKFSGEHWYNPYEDLPSTRYKVNLHGHSRAYKGVTNGADSPQNMYHAYIEKGYDVAAISNYLSVMEPDTAGALVYIPCYEHGYNVMKAHRQGIGAREVMKWDFPLWQWSSHKQALIYWMQEGSDLVAVNHPKMRNGHRFVDLERIVGYDLMEVTSVYGKNQPRWDHALSAGRPSFLLANDDTHSLEKQSFRNWTWVYAGERSRESILSALKAGRAFGVRCTFGHPCEKALDSLHMTSDTLEAWFSGNAAELRVIGQDGEVRSTASDTNYIRFVAGASDTYLRVEAEDPDELILGNPVIRYNGVSLDSSYPLVAGVNTLQTWMFRLAVLLVHLFLVWLLVSLVRGNWWRLKSGADVATA